MSFWLRARGWKIIPQMRRTRIHRFQGLGLGKSRALVLLGPLGFNVFLHQWRVAAAKRRSTRGEPQEHPSAL